MILWFGFIHKMNSTYLQCKRKFKNEHVKVDFYFHFTISDLKKLYILPLRSCILVAVDSQDLFKWSLDSISGAS